MEVNYIALAIPAFLILGWCTENYEIQSNHQIMELGCKQRNGHYGNAQA